MTRPDDAEAYLRELVVSGRECDHPPRFRVEPEHEAERPFEAKTLDPKVWQCQVCGTVQVRKP